PPPDDVCLSLAPPPPPCIKELTVMEDGDWALGCGHEELRLRELEEARTRALQLEKTMRWWSDCTASWREKWAKVRAERNRAREEASSLRERLEGATAELAEARRERRGMSADNARILREAGGPRAETERRGEEDEGDEGDGEQEPVRDTQPGKLSVALPSNKDTTLVEEPWEKRRDAGNYRRGAGPAGRLQEAAVASAVEEELARATVLRLRLDESLKTLLKERENNLLLAARVHECILSVSKSKDNWFQTKLPKQRFIDQLALLREAHEAEMGRMTEDLEDQVSAHSSMDKKLSDMRAELERLQAENAAEWGKRERLDTEKLALERDNKKLRLQLDDLEEQLSKRRKQTASASDADLRSVQAQLYEKNKELCDLRHAYGKQRKAQADVAAELAHAQRRAEQSEAEVKKLRQRVDELKREAARAEDELDETQNQVRRLQRSLDEQVETSENLQVQLEHLQTRYRAQPSKNPFLGKLRN
uniref:Coiled-coil domain-containing protein 102A n=1 Tax=Petromyzon marinus TaxID=7757 RepID=S4REJ7_PETMA